MEKIEHAVILAAGKGTRLKGYCGEIPKGFIRVASEPIIETSIKILISNGIKRITIVTGYLSHFYEKLSLKYLQVQTVKNLKFSESGSMFSLFEARNCIDGDFILLESDIVYETRAVKAILNSEDKNVILISGATHSDDEVYVDAKGDRVVQITKDRKKVKHLAGELVGISKISYELYEFVLKEVLHDFENTLFLEYDSDTLSKVSKKININYLCLDNLAWGEIDTEKHFDRVKDLVYPRIISNNKEFTA